MTLREEVAQAIRDALRRYPVPVGLGRCLEVADAVLPLVTRAVAAEREACARIAEVPYSDEVGALGGRKHGDEPVQVGKKIAAAIRARMSPGASG